MVSSKSVWEHQSQLVNELHTDASEGSLESFSHLVRLATYAVKKIEELTHADFSDASGVARSCSTWPVLLGHNVSMSSEQRQLLKRLKLDTAGGSPFKKQKNLSDSPVTRKIAFFLLSLTERLRIRHQILSGIQALTIIKKRILAMEIGDGTKIAAQIGVNVAKELDRENGGQHTVSHAFAKLASAIEIPIAIAPDGLDDLLETAHNLPPLRHGTKDKWFGFGKLILLRITEDRPEKNPVLWKIGQYRKDVYYRKDVSNRHDFEKRKATAKAKATEDANIRDGIFQRIKSAYAVVMKEQGEDLPRGARKFPTIP